MGLKEDLEEVRNEVASWPDWKKALVDTHKEVVGGALNNGGYNGPLVLGPGSFVNLPLPKPLIDPVHGFVIKDSGKREEFESGMVRDTSEGKIQFHRVLEGPMFKRWAVHLTKGAVKYPDNENGTANWTKACGTKEHRRFKESALRHFVAWYYGDQDEDHAAGVLFNINGAEYTR